LTKPRIGLALGGGSARGWAHIGVIEALAEAGVQPDIVCGCSIGALVGAAHVANALPALKKFALALNMREISRYIDIRFADGGLMGGREIVKLLRSLDIRGNIEDVGRPFAAVATDLETGREIWLREGPIEDAVRASISIPGVLAPVHSGGRWLVDGGVVNPVPVSLCRALGADIVIAVNLNADLVGRATERREATKASATTPELLARLVDRTPAPLRKTAESILPSLISTKPASPGYFNVLLTSINIMQEYIANSRLAGEPPHVTLAPRLRDIGFLEFHRAPEAIEEGRASVAHALPHLKRLIERG